MAVDRQMQASGMVADAIGMDWNGTAVIFRLRGAPSCGNGAWEGGRVGAGLGQRG